MALPAGNSGSLNGIPVRRICSISCSLNRKIGLLPFTIASFTELFFVFFLLENVKVAYIYCKTHSAYKIFIFAFYREQSNLQEVF